MKTRLLHSLIVVLTLVALCAATAAPLYAARAASVVRGQTKLLTFAQFVESVADGQAGLVRGVYVQGVLALRVKQQPLNRPDYVSATSGVATQFQMAADNGVIGLLAHNYSSGALFSALQINHEVRIVYGDKTVKTYIVSAAYQYQVLEPNNVRSDLVDLSTGTRVSVVDAFYQVYGSGDHVTFQTCIKRGNDLSWGRLFVVATPVP